MSEDEAVTSIRAAFGRPSISEQIKARTRLTEIVSGNKSLAQIYLSPLAAVNISGLYADIGTLLNATAAQ